MRTGSKKGKNSQTPRFSKGFSCFFCLRMVGLEPTRGRPRKILSLVRLPFRHIRLSQSFLKPISIITQCFPNYNIFLICVTFF